MAIEFVQKSKKTVAKSAYGEKLETPLPYEYAWSEYKTPADMREAGDYPNEKGILKLVNNQRKAKARQKELTATLTAAGIEKPTAANDPQIRLENVYDSIMLGVPVEDREKDDVIQDAREKASALLGIAWEDEDDE